jgi:protoporphyrin/coproporphyrin ferrochelatase
MTDAPTKPDIVAEPIAEPPSPPTTPREVESAVLPPVAGSDSAAPLVDAEEMPAAQAPEPAEARTDVPAPSPQATPPAAERHALENLAAPSSSSSAPTAPAADLAAAGEESSAASAIGVLLVNLGTPDAADAPAVRRYLKQFLTDPRVIEKNSLIWKLVLNGIILPLRSRRKAGDYRKIWNEEKNESPLKTVTRAQAEKLAAILEPLGKNIVVDWAMRYASPSIASRLEAMQARGCGRILVMPLYPQYAAPTTATVCDEVFRFLMKQRRQPALRVLPAYYDEPSYVEALASSLDLALKALPFTPDVIVASYHGMPRDYIVKGDPYERQCIRTTELLRAQLKLDESKLMMTFQSRFGRAKWLQPYTIKTVKALAKKGVKNLVVITPGFSADCLETLEEIAGENAHVFKRYGGERFAAIPCLNDSEAGMQMIRQLALRELKGWV